MKIVQDILTDEPNDLLFANGDFVLHQSDGSHIQAILEAHKGHFRQYPLCGCGIKQYQNTPLDHASLSEKRRQIEVQLRLDRYVVSHIELTNMDNNKLHISIHANRN